MKNWEEKTLADVLDVLRNGVNCKQDKKGIGEKISRIESISNADFDIEKVGYSRLSNADKDKYRLDKGDILFSHINSPIHVGKTALFNSDEEVYHGVNLLLMRPKSFLNVRYFEHYLKFIFQNGYWKGLCKQSVNQASVNQQDINKVEISYPKSLPEQQHIVSILDEAFAAIAKAKANAEQNLKNAKELFESYLQGVFEKKGEGWEEKTVEELCENVTVGFVGKMANKYKETGIPFLRSQNIKAHQIDLKDVIFIDQAFNSEIKKSQLCPGDLAIVRTGYPGTAAVIPESLPISNCSDIVIVKVGHKIDPYFLCYFFNSTYGKKLVLGNIVGAAQKHFNVGAAKKVKIPVPSIEKQRILIKNLDALSAETKRLEGIYKQKIEDLEELKKSVLQKAFRGELGENV